jgi:hypothetical protein
VSESTHHQQVSCTILAGNIIKIARRQWVLRRITEGLRIISLSGHPDLPSVWQCGNHVSIKHDQKDVKRLKE